MTTLTFSGLGTSWWVEIFDDITDERRASITDSVTALVRSFEQRYSRFLPNSLISQLNTTRTLTAPDADLITLLTTGQTLARLSRGTFNFLLGDHLAARGYDSTYSFVERAAPPVMANPLLDLTITPEKLTLSAGSIDLGGYGKGYLIDLIAEHLTTQYTLRYFLINGGGDLYGTSDHGTPLTIYLEHPLGGLIGSTTLIEQGFAASSPYKRQWKTKSGDTTHHIVSSGTLTADASFIIAPTATLADGFATISLLMAPEEFADSCRQHHIAVALYEAGAGQLHRSVTFPFTPLPAV